MTIKKLYEKFCCLASRVKNLQDTSDNLVSDTVKGDIEINDKNVTVAGFDPSTMKIIDVQIDPNIVPETDGFIYTGRRNGNTFLLSSEPNDNYAGAFCVTYITL